MNLIVETPYEDGWTQYRAITNIKGNKAILVDGEEIEFEKLRLKKIELYRVVFYIEK